jgi:hypothetical protein
MTELKWLRKPSKSWCHEHLVWECSWIDGLENPDFANRKLVMCHEAAISEEKPWCLKHEPKVPSE